MTRTLALRCPDCGQRFGGSETLNRHRYLAGDQYRCRTVAELTAKAWLRDQVGVWHRTPTPVQTSLLGPTETDRTAYVLYDGTPPHEAVSTSHAAAVEIQGAVNRLQGVVFREIQDSGDRGVTDDELEMRTGLKHQTVSARRRELYLLGRIRSVGVRPTRSGRKAKVWVSS